MQTSRSMKNVLWLTCGLFIALLVLLLLPDLPKPSPARADGPGPTRRVNVPFFPGQVDLVQGAILWFGQVNNTSNYADVRLGYSDTQLVISLHAFDRRLWYDNNGPAAGDLTAWDAATLYLNLNGNTGDIPQVNSYRFVAQVNHWQARDPYQAAYRGNGSGWVEASTVFTTTTGWRGNGFNDTGDDRGWSVKFYIPFASLGLAGPPPSGTSWGLALALHDRDDAAGTSIPKQVWPEVMDDLRPSTWGQLVFGQPGYTPPPASPGQTVIIRHGLNGASVVDGEVGGHTVCGSSAGPGYFESWGNTNYAGYDQINIQNQWDVADWPCFSKFYIIFPLDSLPAGQTVISSTLAMFQFGNANPAQAKPSLIQVMTTAEDWDESALTWNNAPLALENVASTWVNPLPSFPGWPGQPVAWDVSRAVAEAYAAHQPLRLVLYSADADYHSGKYFSSSDTGNWNAVGRPTLQILLGNSSFELDVSPAAQVIRSGRVATYTVEVRHHPNFTHDVDVFTGASPSSELAVNLAPPTTFSPPDGGQTLLVLSDLHPPSFTTGVLYTVPITVAGGGITQTTSVKLLVNGSQVHLPTIIK